MLNYLEHSLSASLAFAFAGGVLWWLLLRFLDWLAGGWGHFKRGPLPIIHRGSLATAVYYGLRALAAAIVVGDILASVRL